MSLKGLSWFLAGVNGTFRSMDLLEMQHSIVNFAVPFLKMLTLYTLWRAQSLPEFHDVFRVVTQLKLI